MRETMRHNENARESEERSQGSREPMTGRKLPISRRLPKKCGREPSAFAENLSKREASRRIDALAERVRLSHLPPHTD
jgi:hypothetical protein